MSYEFEKATYSRKALTECVTLVKATNWTVDKKAYHFCKCFEIEKIFDFCREKTNCCLFETNFSVWDSYLKAVDRKASKKELDTLLKACYRFLCNELNSISTMMTTGEVNEID